MRLQKKILSAVALSAAAALALSGCSGGGGSSAGSNTVTISGAFTGAQATAFQADLTKWGKTQGITVKYSGSNSFQTGIVTQVKGGQAPDLAIFPQPGVLK